MYIHYREKIQDLSRHQKLFSSAKNDDAIKILMTSANSNHDSAQLYQISCCYYNYFIRSDTRDPKKVKTGLFIIMVMHGPWVIVF